MPHTPKLVRKGNRIHVSPHDLENNKINVKWNQNLLSRNEEYFVAKYVVMSGGGAEGAIFVQCNKVDEFKALCSGEQFTLDVSDHFQYGQDKEQKNRFLVFHDKEHKALQQRFVDNALSAGIAQVAGWLGIKSMTNPMEEATKMFSGAYLHDF